MKYLIRKGLKHIGHPGRAVQYNEISIVPLMVMKVVSYSSYVNQIICGAKVKLSEKWIFTNQF